LYYACAQTAISGLPIKILTWPLDSASRFAKRSDNLAIRQRFYAVTFDLWHLLLTFV